jgi:hypothetical protein
MTFDELSNEAKLLFVIHVGEQTLWMSQILDRYANAGGPKDREVAAWNEFGVFLSHCRQASIEERRRRKEQQKKADARMRA